MGITAIRRAFARGARTSALALATAAAAAALFVAAPAQVRAADHADGPNLSHDQGADLADTYIFLNPNDNSKVVIIMTVHGFIVPGEAVNFAFFDPNIRYRFAIEQTGDLKFDRFIDVTFTQRVSTTNPQTATITLPNGRKFTAPTTLPNLSATAAPFTVTTDPNTGVKFFAGETDDPFFFDIPAFSRFVSSIRAGSPDASHLSRGRDTFAGYNILSIALELPVDMVKGPNRNTVGLQAQTQRKTQTMGAKGEFKRSGSWKTVDREGLPAINAVVVPTPLKNAYNVATLQDDARGRFAADLVATLKALGTNDEFIGIIAELGVAHGDILTFDFTKANAGPGGGNNASGFPNGRRLADDVVDTFLSLVANGATIGDSVPANDLPFQDNFPFLALPQQPRAAGTVDDNTRN